MAGCTNLSVIPNDLSVDYFKGVELTKRAKERGYNFFVNGYVHGLKLYSSGNETCIDVGAKCFRSMRKSEAPHSISVTLEVKEKSITERHCTCKAGITGTCSHTVAVIFQLAHYKNLGLTDVPSELACTSMPQQWHKPRGPKIDAEPVSTMVFAKPKPTPRKKKPVHSMPLNFSVPDVTMEDVKKLKTHPAASGTPLSYLLTCNDQHFETTKTEIGNVQLGSMLPLQLRHYKPIPAAITNPSQCGDITFPRIISVIDADTLQKYSHLNIFFSTTQAEAVFLEGTTRQQSNNPLWFNERKSRITASQFFKICKRKKEITSKFVDSIFSCCNFQSEATTYGKKNENTAKQVYMEKNPDHHIHDCGLVVNPSFSYLAASPDGKICMNNETGVLEIKCPYSARDLTILDAVQSIPNFCLKLVDGSLALPKSHEYFYQIQGQLMVTGALFCIFVLYTKKDFYVEKIPVDIEFIQQMFVQLSKFYEDHHPNL